MNVKVLPYAVELLDTLPKKDSIKQSNAIKSKSVRQYGIITPAPAKPDCYPIVKAKAKPVEVVWNRGIIAKPVEFEISGRIHTKTPDTRSGRF